ncbi:MAG: trehalose 6-phosphate phosphatase [Acidobacteriaceae bacterium]|jgi:trehalose-phosphatase|nr:trehalose 6-phosphate phosphatase [Acidobacteriaceae bacterium]
MNQFPQEWARSAEATVVEQQLRSAARSVLMLDYDGTLAPFHINRFDATPYPGVEERLVTLSTIPQVRLVLVSGRSARELRDLLRPGIRGEIWGSHGRERLESDGTYELFALSPMQQAALEQVGLEMSALGFSDALEVKPTSLAIHWRGFEPAMQVRIRSVVQSIFVNINEPGGLHLLPFDGGVELRSTDRTKGTAVAEILSRGPDDAPVAYLGDDLTDEDAFVALGNQGYSILVRGEVRASSARFWLRPPEELLGFLDGWIVNSQIAHAAATTGASR